MKSCFLGLSGLFGNIDWGLERLTWIGNRGCISYGAQQSQGIFHHKVPWQMLGLQQAQLHPRPLIHRCAPGPSVVFVCVRRVLCWIYRFGPCMRAFVFCKLISACTSPPFRDCNPFFLEKKGKISGVLYTLFLFLFKQQWAMASLLFPRVASLLCDKNPQTKSSLFQHVEHRGNANWRTFSALCATREIIINALIKMCVCGSAPHPILCRFTLTVSPTLSLFLLNLTGRGKHSSPFASCLRAFQSNLFNTYFQETFHTVTQNECRTHKHQEYWLLQVQEISDRRKQGRLQCFQQRSENSLW